MKRVDTNKKMPRARLLAIAAAAVAISACGGGGGGFSGLPIAPPPAPVVEQAQPVDSSAPCFNEADFREGTLVEFEAAMPSASAATTAFRRKSVTQGREVFAGANPVAFNVGTETSGIPSMYEQKVTKKEYKDLVNGSILLYGKTFTDETKVTPEVAAQLGPDFVRNQVLSVSDVFTPPFSFPVDMKRGQVVSQQSSVIRTRTFKGRSDPTTSLPATAELTYHGREKLETSVGTFDTCKFSLKVAVGVSAISMGVTKEMWLAAEGPYRGQLLKGVDPKSPALVTKMTYTPN